MDQQFILFKLAGEYYGVDIAAIESIIKMQPITTVPQSPGSVEGVINLRGVVLPVLDLRRRFGLPRQEADKETRIIVVETAGRAVGLVVDAVSEVLRIPPEDIEPPSVFVTTVDSAFITGIAKVAERLVTLLDLAQLLLLEEQVRM